MVSKDHASRPEKCQAGRIGANSRRTFIGGTMMLVAVLLHPAANAQTWTSPDGFLSITPPDANDYQAMEEPPAPFVGLWVSNDETVKFGVMKTPYPPNMRLIQSSAEQGLAEEIGGTVTRLPTKTVAGYEVWKMTGKGSAFEITQAIIRHEDTIYKLMALKLGGELDTVAVNRFLDSLSIDAQPGPDLGGKMDVHELSKSIGGAGALLGIGLLDYVLSRRNKQRSA